MDPNDLDVEEMEPSSSNGTDTLDVTDATPKDGAAEAEQSSTSTDDVTETSELYDVVRDVVDKRKDPAEAASSAEGEEGQQEDAGSSAEGEQGSDDYADVPFGKHPRFKQLLNERNSFKADAERYQSVVTFMDRNSLSSEDAANSLVIAGLIKTNPPKAWEMLKPIVQGLLEAAGEVLPAELKARVEAGEMTREAALDVSRSNARVRAVETNQTFEQQRSQREQQQQNADSLKTEASRWETERTQRDPNFATKTAALHREVAWLQKTEGVPTTPQGVREQLDKAYKAVNAALPPARQAPAPRPAARPIVSSNQSAPKADPKPPASTLDIVDSVLAKRRSA